MARTVPVYAFQAADGSTIRFAVDSDLWFHESISSFLISLRRFFFVLHLHNMFCPNFLEWCICKTL